MQLSGVGETTATALVAVIGNGHDFQGGRQLAAWLELVPGQYSSGGKARLGHITKAGDRYLRSLLVMRARALPNAAKDNTYSVGLWALSLADGRATGRQREAAKQPMPQRGSSSGSFGVTEIIAE